MKRSIVQFLVVLLAVFSVLGCVEETQPSTGHEKEAENMLQLHKSLVLSRLRSDIADIRNRIPRCGEGDPGFPCWGYTTLELIRYLGGNIEEVGGVRRETRLTELELGLEPGDLDHFYELQNDAEAGLKFQSLSTFPACSSPTSCWNSCRQHPKDGDGVTPLWFQKIQRAEAIAGEFEVASITGGIIFRHGQTGFIAEEVRFDAEDVRCMPEESWRPACIAGLEDALVNYPEVGREDATPRQLVDSIRHLGGHGELNDAMKRAYARQGRHMVELFRKGRKDLSIVFPGSKEWVWKINAIASDGNLRFRDFGTSKEELIDLTGEFPKTTPVFPHPPVDPNL